MSQIKSIEDDHVPLRRIYTSTIRNRSTIETDLGIRCINTTVKSGGPEFAPTWAMVLGSKDGTLSAEDYAQQYEALMRDSQERYYQYWEDLILSDEPFSIYCYCSAGNFCHRLLLVDILIEYAKRVYNIDWVYGGELTLDHIKSIKTAKDGGM